VLGLTESLRHRVVASATGPFQHAPYPLARTLAYRGDPGLFGPGSISWTVIGDSSSFAGGIRALLVQAAHPEVVAGVADHSRYREVPLGRLSRTSAYVTATTYGAMPEVEHAVDLVRRAHRRVVGTSHRGRPYTADMAQFAAWVHNALTDSFLATYQAYAPRPLAEADADRFVEEQTRVGHLLGADPLPTTARELRIWLATHPEAAPSPGMTEALAFLESPPLTAGVRAGYQVLFQAAVSTIPARLRSVLDISPRPGARSAGRASVAFLRWALGASPSWHVALIRTGSPVPPGLFRQPLPLDRLEQRAS
jgi:uncharacterized protein (DUF2236 family)